MEIITNKTDDILVVELQGRLDAANFDKANDFFAQVVDQETKILIDCEKLDYINSSGLRTLIVSLKKTNAEGKLLVLCNLNDLIKKVFKVAGFDNLFNLDLDKQLGLSALA